MDERSNLIDQIKGLQDNLRQTRNTLGSVLDKKLITPELHKAIDSRFQNLLTQWETKLENRLKSLNYPNTTLNAVWNGLQVDRKECDAILMEFVAFLGGTLIRQNQLDNGVCTIADKILAYLSSRSDILWTRMTILGEGYFFADMTEIIRLRFPEFTIWNLPIVGHEFGHFVGRELRKRIKDSIGKRDFIIEIIEQEGKQNLSEDEKKKEEDYLYEHLADIFATYSLGPAFAFTSILLKFNPNQNNDGESHPSDVKRVYIILKTLENMNRIDRGDYNIIIQRFRECWQVSLDQLEQSTTFLPNGTKRNIINLLDNRLNELYSILDNEIPHVRYKNENWLRALSLSTRLTGNDPINLSQHQYKLIDVLNAAWKCRLMNPEKEKDINKSAITLCNQIINCGQP